ncbi:LOW QUALITY PROTEIN: hypothetical protein ACHAXS_009136 [Conticribra weissflogii]
MSHTLRSTSLNKSSLLICSPCTETRNRYVEGIVESGVGIQIQNKYNRGQNTLTGPRIFPSMSCRVIAYADAQYDMCL